MIRILGISIVLLSSSLAMATSNPGPRAPQSSERQRIQNYNASQSQKMPAPQSFTATRPYAEYENAKFLLMTSESWDSTPIKTKILQGLPKGVTAVILVRDASRLAQYKKQWASVVPADRLKFVIHSSAESGSFWARDAFPIPVYGTDANGNEGLHLIDAKNWHNAEPDQAIATALQLPLEKHTYYYEGGNFQADAKGNCFLVNNDDVKSVPDSVFRNFYGCKSINRLPYLVGIGHVDEVLRMMSDELIFTTQESYRATFEKLGFEVKVLPVLKGYRTHANALLLNKTIFLPTYSGATDAVATAMFQAEGMTVVPIDSRTISDDGEGSIHCITMAYPEGSFVASSNDPDLVEFNAAMLVP